MDTTEVEFAESRGLSWVPDRVGHYTKVASGGPSRVSSEWFVLRDHLQDNGQRQCLVLVRQVLECEPWEAENTQLKEEGGRLLLPGMSVESCFLTR